VLRLFNNIASDNIKNLFILHLIVGTLAVISKYAFILWFYIVLLQFFTLSKSNQKIALPYLLGYLIPVELMSRILFCSPFIPWELSKYLGTALLIYGIALNNNRKNGAIAIPLLLLIIPGLLITLSQGQRVYVDIVYNFLGPAALCFSIIYFSNIVLSPVRVYKIFLTISMGGLSILTYLIAKLRNVASINFNLGANAQVTDGFGPNQVSTVLGLVFGVSFFLWLHKVRIFNKVWKDLVFSALFLFWALLTFSRGGVIAVVLPLILIILLVPKPRYTISPRKFNLKFIAAIIVLFIGLGFITNRLTGGSLLLRYQGETYATQKGYVEKDLNEVSSGRLEVFQSDWQMWQDNFLFGVGVGQSYYERVNYGYRLVSAHVEVSRLLSEHGLFGFVFSIIFLFYPVILFLKANSAFQKSIIIFCMGVAIATSMHSAMRTFVTPLLYGMGTAIVVIPRKVISDSKE